MAKKWRKNLKKLGRGAKGMTGGMFGGGQKDRGGGDEGYRAEAATGMMKPIKRDVGGSTISYTGYE